MAASAGDIREWVERGKKEGATHVLIVCDTYDHDDYPVFVLKHEDVRTKAAPYERGENMSRLMEVYSLTGKHDVEDQFREHRAFHYD